MSDLAAPTPQPATPTPVIHEFDAEVIFPIVADATRRQLLARLAAGKSLAASQMAPGASRRLDAVLKHLAALRAAGLILINADTADRRRQLYTLSPAVTVRTVAGRLELDFGCCVVRMGNAA